MQKSRVLPQRFPFSKCGMGSQNFYFNKNQLGLPWRSSGYDSELPMQGAWVQSLVRELGSQMPRSTAKKKKKRNQLIPSLVALYHTLKSAVISGLS